MTLNLRDRHGNSYEVEVGKKQGKFLTVRINNQPLTAEVLPIDAHTCSVEIGGRIFLVGTAADEQKIYAAVDGTTFEFEKSAGGGAQRPGMDSFGDDDKHIGAPMPGKILKIFVKEGQAVKKGERLFIIEAMKMENEVKAPRAAKIAKINCREAQLVGVGDILMEFDD